MVLLLWLLSLAVSFCAGVLFGRRVKALPSTDWMSKWEPVVVSFLRVQGESSVNGMCCHLDDHTGGEWDFHDLPERDRYRLLDRMVSDGTLKMRHDHIFGRVYSLRADAGKLLEPDLS